MLHRITYIQDGAPRGVTFAGANMVEALEFAELWERVTKCPVLTIKPLGASKITVDLLGGPDQGRAVGGETHEISHEIPQRTERANASSVRCYSNRRC